MDHKHLESFAQEARRQLLRQVDARVSLLLNTDSGLLRESAEAVDVVRQMAAKRKGRPAPGGAGGLHLV